MVRRLTTTGFVAANITATVVASSPLSGSVVSASAVDEPERPPGADCYADNVTLTVEEQRITQPLPGADTAPAARRFIEAASPAFEEDRTAVVDQTAALVEVAGAVAPNTGVEAMPWPSPAPGLTLP